MCVLLVNLFIKRPVALFTHKENVLQAAYANDNNNQTTQVKINPFINLQKATN